MSKDYRLEKIPINEEWDNFISASENVTVFSSSKYLLALNAKPVAYHCYKKETVKVHFKGFQNLIKIFSKKNIKLFLQVGSSLEYGKSKSPQREKYICKPISVYGKAKYLASKVLARSDIKKFIILRL